MVDIKGFTATIIFEAQSLNFDEGYGSNLSVIKKLHRGNGEVYSYSSRQSLRYSMFIQGLNEFRWTASDVERSGGNKTVIQLITPIKESEESDLFGYMRTDVGVDDMKDAASISRTSPVRILPAISLEPFSSDMEMLTNKYQADKREFQSNIANFENHRSLYRYSICIDLHRIGSEADKIGTRFTPNKELKKDDPNKEKFINFEQKLREQNITFNERSNRVCQLLEIVGRLYRDIRGRREDLKPLFVAGGVYDTLNPFFENIVNLEWNAKGSKPKINTASLNDILERKYQVIDNKEKSVNDDTFIGITDGFFSNDLSKELNGKKKSVALGSPGFAIDQMKKEVREYYKEQKKKEEQSKHKEQTNK